MFGLKNIQGIQRGLNAAKSILKNATSGINNVNNLASELGIVNNGEYQIAKAPEIIQIKSNEHDTNQAWFRIYRTDNDGTTLEAARTTQGHISNSTSVKLKKPIVSTLAILKLPYPQSIETNNNIQWSNHERGLLAAVSKTGLAKLNTIGGAADAAKHLVLAAAKNSVFGKEAQFRTKNVVNPKLAALFTGVDLREVAFSFEFAPTSKDEVNSIIDVIESIQLHSHPVQTPFGLKYPSEFGIKINTKDFSLIDMDRCVVTSIKTDMTSQGILALYEDGFPVVVTMDVSFKETEAKTRKTIDTIRRS